MAAAGELARLKRSVAELIRALKPVIDAPEHRSEADRSATRAEIERCIQQLDELRNRL